MAPFKIPTSFGPIAQSPSGAFKWHTISLAGNSWPLLPPATVYWVALLPGATYSPPQSGPGLNGGFGIQWGGIAAPAPAGLLPSGTPASSPLYSAREIGSQGSATDSKHICNAPASLTFLRAQTNWASLPGYGATATSPVKPGRYESFASFSNPANIRHGAVLYGAAA